MEKTVSDLQAEIHALLLDLEAEVDQLIQVGFDAFPELGLKYPDLGLAAIKVSSSSSPTTTTITQILSSTITLSF